MVIPVTVSIRRGPPRGNIFFLSSRERSSVPRSKLMYLLFNSKGYLS